MDTKLFLAIGLAAVLGLTAGCQQASPSAPSAEESSAVLSEEMELKNSWQSEVVSEVGKLPEGVFEYKTGYLKYVNSRFPYALVFPREFSELNRDYVPETGICLQNADGTAVLTIEQAVQHGIGWKDLVDLLKKKYPDGKTIVTDTKQVVCRTKTKDKSGNEVWAYLKATLTEEGYIKAVLIFDERNKDRYDSVFNQISFE